MPIKLVTIAHNLTKTRHGGFKLVSLSRALHSFHCNESAHPILGSKTCRRMSTDQAIKKPIKSNDNDSIQAATTTSQKHILDEGAVDEYDLDSECEDNFHSQTSNQSSTKSKTGFGLTSTDGRGLGDVPQTVFFNGIIKPNVSLNENNYIYKHIHKRMVRFAHIGQMVNTLPINSQIESLEDLMMNKKKSNSLNDYKESIEDILGDIKASIKYMNQQELAILLTAIKDRQEDEFKKVKRMIDIELRWLLKKHVNTRLMDLDLWLCLADIFYECNMRSTFVNVLVNYMAKDKEVELSNKQFLHLLFLIILQRHQSGILSIYEERILQTLDKASFEDIATICLAYFKTKTAIKNTNILRKVIDRTTEFLPNIDPKEPGYCSIIKSLRYSRNVECRENISHLMHTLIDDPDCKIILTSPYNTVHTIKLMESYRIYDSKLLSLMYKIMFENLNEFRIKDIQYALTSLSNFAFKDLRLTREMRKNFDQLCNDIMEEKRLDSYFQFPHLMPMLRAFSMFGYYNSKFIKYVNQHMENPSKLIRMRYAIEFERSALLNYVATKIESNKDIEYNLVHFKNFSNSIERVGNFGSVRQDSSIKHLDFILRSTKTQTFYENSNLYRDVSLALANNNLLGDSSYKINFQYTLPHQNFADLIISKNCREPGSFSAYTLLPQKIPSGQRHCLVLATRKHDYIDGHERLSGYKRLVRRLLEKLGYIVLNVDINEPKIDELAYKIHSILEKGAQASSS